MKDYTIKLSKLPAIKDLPICFTAAILISAATVFYFGKSLVDLTREAHKRSRTS